MKRITAEEPESSSTDFIAENIAQMTRLFPEAFAEGKVNFAVLEELLGDAIDKSEKKYGLNWHGKSRARLLALQPTTGTLRPCREESVGWDSTKNLMIEGDNLEVLKLLQKSYANTVKLIFIDPPDNTGKDFVYSDKLQGRHKELPKVHRAGRWQRRQALLEHRSLRSVSHGLAEHDVSATEIGARAAAP